MEQVRKLLKSTAIRKAVPKKTSATNAVRLLYVEAYANSTGYYRMILPYLELGKTKDFQTHITSVKKWDFRNASMPITSGLFQEEEIQWADYIIFPMLWQDYTYLLKAIKVLNPKVQLVMDIVEDFDHPNQISTRVEHLLQNICLMDMITTASVRVFERYEQWLVTYPECGHVELCVLPSLISKIGYEGLVTRPKPKDGIVRLGVICEVPYFDYYDYMFPVFRTLKEKYGDRIELIFLGSKGVTVDGKTQEAFDLKITHHKTVSFFDYFQTLQDSHLDMLMIPLRPNMNHDLKGTMLFLEAAAIGLPVIAPRDSSYANVIKHMQTGILLEHFEDWIAQLAQLIESEDIRKKLGAAAQKFVWKQFAYHENTLQHFRDIFI